MYAHYKSSVFFKWFLIVILLTGWIGIGQQTVEPARGTELLVDNLPDLIVTVTANPTPVPAGVNITYTVTVRNGGKAEALNVSLVNTLPAEVTYLSHNSGSFLCSESSGVLSCNIGILKKNVSAVVTITGQVSHQASGSLINQAEAYTASEESDYSNNTVTTSTTITHEADLQLGQTASAPSIKPGEEIVFTLQVTNLGPSQVMEVSLSEVLPIQLAPLLATPSQGDCSLGQTVTCALGTLSVNQTVTVNVVAQVNQLSLPGPVVIQGSVSAGGNDPDPSNNQASATVTVEPGDVNLSISLSGPQSAVTPDQVFTYTLTVTNAGPGPATGVNVSNHLPDTVTHIKTTTSQGECSGTTPVLCNLGLVYPGAGVQISIQVRVRTEAESTLTTTAEVTSLHTEENISDNQAVHTVSIDTQADLRVSAADDPDPVLAGSTLNYIVSVTNRGPSQARDTVLTIVLSQHVSYLSSTPGLDVCSLVGSILTCSLSTLNRTEAKQVALEVQVADTYQGTISLEASVSSVTNDPDPSNNSATESTQVLPRYFGDTISPSLDWQSPVGNGERYDVRGEPVMLVVTASDNIAIDYVRFYRWDAVSEEFIDIGYRYQAPYEFELNTSDLRYSWNDVRARAYDEAGNSSTLRAIWLYRISQVFLPLVSR